MLCYTIWFGQKENPGGVISPHDLMPALRYIYPNDTCIVVFAVLKSQLSESSSCVPRVAGSRDKSW